MRVAAIFAGVAVTTVVAVAVFAPRAFDIFAGHTDDDEIYMQEYQTLSIYSKDLAKYEQVLSSLGYTKNKDCVLSWDVIDKDNVGECINVEADDESYIDMINNLIDVGMYPAE